MQRRPNTSMSTQNPKYSTQGDSFVIENYNSATPFSSFFPALAGENGKPLWLFYANRGQSVASFGVNNKDGAMVEFLPANKAYQSTPLLGFRTFISMSNKKGVWHEPFSMLRRGPHQRMIVRPYELELIDNDPESDVSFQVVYFGVPHERVSFLGRSLTFTNRSKKTVQFNAIDGLPRVVPYGMNDYLVKNMSRTIEAFAEVGNIKTHVPFFKLKIEPSDRPELSWLNSGFFSFCLSNSEFVPAIVDPVNVFGSDTSFFQPHSLFGLNSPTSDRQMTSNIMPSSFFSARMTLAPGQSKTWTSYFGYSASAEEALHLGGRVKEDPTYFQNKRQEMKKLYEDLVNRFGFQTGIENLNNYANVNFMDNVLRGGLPVSFEPSPTVLHLYSRKHGDMERDYNSFQISATHFSQGNGNFRDVNQNRRNDLFVTPQIGAANVEYFFNLLQMDGYNPLVLNPIRFFVPSDLLGRPSLANSEESKRDFKEIRKGAVLAGQIYEFVQKYSSDPLNINNVFREIIRECSPQVVVQHGEGYWIDHWTYNLDHLDQFLSIYPEKKMWLLFEKNDFTYHDSDHAVRPRREKYVITLQGSLRQYQSVVENLQKKELINSRIRDSHLLRIDNGQGDVLRTNLFVKLLSLVAVKASSLDPMGMGIEMEADKPGWCDALNGLPGLFGSSSHELFELHRLVKFMREEAIPVSPHKTIEVPTEVYALVREIEEAFQPPVPKDFRQTWDKIATARENFRERSFFGVSSKTRSFRMIELGKILEKISAVLASAEKKIIDPKTGLPTSYFYYSVEPAELESTWRQYLYKINWKQHRVVPFLEGAVHSLKGAPLAQASKIHKAVRRSDLFDKKLGMYKLNVSLADESTEIGRIRVFSAGWLENESIFLHMHYKYLLEILRSGLTDVFYQELKQGLVPFLNPKTYGRSIFENSSFIASSSFPDRSLQGKGFVARLSGATSEFISMIYCLFVGPKPFRLHEGVPVFQPEPMIPPSWFSSQEKDNFPKHSVKLMLFGVPVTFINSSGASHAKPVSFEWILEGRFHDHAGRHLPADASQAFRSGRLECLTIHIGKIGKK